MLLFRSAILRAPDDGSASGGNGESQAKPLTEEDIGRIANQAITAQLKRLNIDGKITEAISSLDLDGKFKALTESLKPATLAGEGGEKQAPSSGIPPEVAKQLQQLSEKLEASEAARKAEREALEEVKTKHQFDAGRQRLYESLKEHADPNLHDVWVDHLIHHQRLKIEENEPLLEVEYSPIKGLPKQKEFLPLAEAIPHLVGSQDSKRFMPPPEAASGAAGKAPRGRRGQPAIDSKNPNDRVRARLASLGLDADTQFG